MRLALLTLLICSCGTAEPSAGDSDQDTDSGDIPDGPRFDTSLQRGTASTSTTATSSSYVCGSGDPTCDADACATNTAPVLGAPLLVVNGVVASSASVGDHVQVVVPYQDAECNAGCGGVQVYYEAPSSAFDSEATSCDDQPCNTADSGVYYAYSFGVLDEAGSYFTSFRVSDACGDRSASADLSFSL